MLIKTGFKEWAIVCAALEQGDQIVILRKGGIAEGKGGFRAEHDEFALVPTYVHQSAKGIKPGLAIGIPEALPGSTPIRITSLARVTDAAEIKSLEMLTQLRSEHVWSDEVVHERFHRWRREAVWMLLVRVARLPEPIVLESHPDYAGCKSWIEFSPPLGVHEAENVMTDDTFEERRQRVLSILG